MVNPIPATTDRRIAYICACCGGFVEVPLSVELIDSGTTLNCEKCNGDTVFHLSRTAGEPASTKVIVLQRGTSALVQSMQ